MKPAIASERTRHETVRGSTVDILTKVDTQKAYADVLLDHALKHASFSDRDRAFLTELTYGTLRWRGRIDWFLNRLVRRPLAEADSFVRNLLRVSLYQLLFLDRIPDYAAVNEAVQLAKEHGGKKAADFVNGVLRNFLRAKNKPHPSLKSGALSGLPAFWSHPEWLVKKWLAYFGRDETIALLKANNEEAPLVMRVNLCKKKRTELLDLLRARGLTAWPTERSPQGIWLKSKSPIELLPGFHEGFFQIQGEASQLVAYLLNAQPGERILDACASPGGKATHIAELTEDRGEIIATDISARGLKKIEQNIDRLGLKSIHTFNADVSCGLTGRLAVAYDRILVDAPCSGLGTLRSHPETKWHRSENDVNRLSRLQKKILAGVSPRLKPGGVLVYATCTLAREENEMVVEDFLARSKDFELEDAASYLPEPARHMVRGGYFLALPHRDNTDGFFAARLRKAA